jgi:hypothetical protein
MDLFIAPTIGFDLLYAFVIVRLHRRDLRTLHGRDFGRAGSPPGGKVGKCRRWRGLPRGQAGNRPQVWQRHTHVVYEQVGTRFKYRPLVVSLTSPRDAWQLFVEALAPVLDLEGACLSPARSKPGRSEKDGEEPKVMDLRVISIPSDVC